MPAETHARRDDVGTEAILDLIGAIIPTIALSLLLIYGLAPGTPRSCP